MATTPVQIRYNSGRGNSVVDVYPRGSDIFSISNRALTESTNAKGIYNFNVTEPLAGWYTVHMKSGSGTILAVYDVYLHDTTAVHLCHDTPDSLTQNEAGFGADAEQDLTDSLTNFGVSTLTAAEVDTELTGTHGSGTWQSAIVAGLSTFDPTPDAVFIDGTKARLDDLNDITVAQILAGTIDGGIDVQLALSAILATVLGLTDVVGDTVTFKDRAGGGLVTVQLSSSIAGKRLTSAVTGE
jgi:hypothetical protein